MPRSDGRELQARVNGAVAEAVLALLIARSLEQPPVTRQDAHADEIDEVPRDDEAPALPGARAQAIVRQQVREVRVHERGPGNTVGRQVVQIVSKMDVRKNKKTLVSGRVHND